MYGNPRPREAALNFAASWVGNTDTEVNPDMLKRVIRLQKLSPDDQQTAIKFIDAFLRDASTRKNYA